MQPFKFIPQLKPVLWGGHRLAQLKHMPASQEPIGESWEISPMPGRESVVAQGIDAGLTLGALIDKYGERLLGRSTTRRYGNQFPLLVKIIDAHLPLSIQVHPDDELAAVRHHCPGKTEMWYVVDAQPDALIMAGLKQSLTPSQFESLTREGHIDQVITHYRPIAGDVFFLPAGTVHSIGAGNLLVEIQQASDITYRLYDYGRLDADGNSRPLHLVEARDAINYAPDSSIASHCATVGSGVMPMVACDHFTTSLLVVDGSLELDWVPERSFLIMVGTAGEINLITDGDCRTALAMGESMLIPACVRSIKAGGKGQAVIAQVPLI